jgi:hypothetical protein
MSTTYIRATQARATSTQCHAARGNALVNHSQLNILSHAFGLEDFANLPPICQELARHMILIAIDLEHWSENTDHTTEVGMCQLLSTAVRPITASGTLGEHGQKNPQNRTLLPLSSPGECSPAEQQILGA